MNLGIFAGWGPCGALNSEGVYDFFGLVVFSILLLYLFGYGIHKLAYKLARTKNSFLNFVSILLFILTILIMALGLSGAFSESH